MRKSREKAFCSAFLALLLCISPVAAASETKETGAEDSAQTSDIDISSIPEIADGTYYLEDFDEDEVHYYELTRSDAPMGGPLLFLLHGTNSNKINMYSFAKVFADDGYVVVVPDLAGHGEAVTDTPLSMFDIVSKSTEYIDQILEYYEEVEYVDPEHFCVAGNSLGGVTALYYAVHGEREPSCVISFYGTPVWSSIADYATRSLRQNGNSVGFPSKEEKDKAREMVIQNSPDGDMETLLRVPILLINGDKDDVMPLQPIKEFKAKAADYPNKLKLVVKKGHVHGLQMDDVKNREARKFLKKHMPVPEEE